MSELVAVCKERLADVDTPVSAYVKLCGGKKDSFLFESGETLEAIGRYSIVAWDPLCSLSLSGEEAVLTLDGVRSVHPWRAFFSLARSTMERMACRDLPPLPFVGSLTGYIGHDGVRLIENLGPIPAQSVAVAELCFPSQFVVFDHVMRSMHLVAIAPNEAEANERITEIEGRLRSNLHLDHGRGKVTVEEPPPERYMEAVRKGKEYIMAGDVFQVVLSDQFKGRTDCDPLAVYRLLRMRSPSPYLFYMNLASCCLVGASPETLVRLENGLVHVRPIAGTRGRSRDPQKDLELEREMLASEKERAEHVMLVDLARNDAGRVSQYGTVGVDPYMVVERFSHVMHITSQVNGVLRPGLDAWDAFEAAFPAGTVSGAPKVRALEIIDELERLPRGAYAGAVGCFGPGPRMDTCIGIRMFQFNGDEFILQTGAGIVADSDPAMEYQEIQHKAAQGIAALRAAAEGSL